MVKARKNGNGKKEECDKEFPYSRNIKRDNDREPLVVRWKVQGFELLIDPKTQAAFNDLNPIEHANLMNQILARECERSDHPEVRSAAVSVTESGRMFITHNTQRETEMYRSCAEINNINVITQLMGAKEKIRHLYFMMGSIENDEEWRKMRLRIFCPCGKCVDALAGCSSDDAKITMFPYNNGTLNIRDIDRNAQYVEEVRSRQPWETSIAHLNRNSVITFFDEERKRRNQEGLDAMFAGQLPMRALDDEEKKQVLDDRVPDERLNVDQQWARKVGKQAQRNSVYRVHSVAEIDADPSLAGINRHMAQEIIETFQRHKDRVEKKEETVTSIRCAVVRLKDGTFHSATEVRGEHINAQPDPEFSTVAKANVMASEVEDMWVMAMDFEDIEKGQMRTSPKDALDRAYKRAVKPPENARDASGKPLTKNIGLCFIPFNDGTLGDAEIERIAWRPQHMREVFASLWPGKQQMPSQAEARRLSKAAAAAQK